MKRILVTGGRDWMDGEIVYEALRRETNSGPSIIIQGGCPTGADNFASIFGKLNFIPQEIYPADWKKHGRAAGPRRNQQMVDSGPDICLAFITERSRGARGTLQMCTKAGIKTIVHYETVLSEK